MRDGIGSRAFHAGDWVIYRVVKQTAHPGRRAREIAPSARGELYSYAVEKQWVVTQVLEGGRLEVATRRGKLRLVSTADPALRRPTLWERWRLRDRFPQVGGSSCSI